MKKSEKQALFFVGVVGVWALLMRNAKAAAQPSPQPPTPQPPGKGTVHIGPVTVTDLGPASAEEQLLWPRLQLAIDQAKSMTHYDEDVGAQKNPGPEGLAHIDGAIALWKKLYSSSDDGTPSALEQMRAQAPRRPTDDSLARATHLVRTLTGWRDDDGAVTRKPTTAEISRIRQAIQLWTKFDENAAEYLQLLLEDSLELSQS